MNQCRGWWQGWGVFQGSEVLQINRQTSQLSCLSRGRVCWQERGKRRRHGSRVASDRPQIKAILFESVEMNQKQFHKIPVIHRDSISHLPTVLNSLAIHPALCSPFSPPISLKMPWKFIFQNSFHSPRGRKWKIVLARDAVWVQFGFFNLYVIPIWSCGLCFCTNTTLAYFSCLSQFKLLACQVYHKNYALSYQLSDAMNAHCRHRNKIQAHTN